MLEKKLAHNELPSCMKQRGNIDGRNKWKMEKKLDFDGNVITMKFTIEYH